MDSRCCNPRGVIGRCPRCDGPRLQRGPASSGNTRHMALEIGSNSAEVRKFSRLRLLPVGTALQSSLLYKQHHDDFTDRGTAATWPSNLPK